jgi:hypothetical protein
MTYVSANEKAVSLNVHRYTKAAAPTPVKAGAPSVASVGLRELNAADLYSWKAPGFHNPYA